MYQLQLSTIAAASSIATTAKTSGSQGASQNTNEGTNDARRGTHDNRGAQTNACRDYQRTKGRSTYDKGERGVVSTARGGLMVRQTTTK